MKRETRTVKGTYGDEIETPGVTVGAIFIHRYVYQAHAGSPPEIVKRSSWVATHIPTGGKLDRYMPTQSDGRPLTRKAAAKWASRSQDLAPQSWKILSDAGGYETLQKEDPKKARTIADSLMTAMRQARDETDMGVL